MAYTFDGTNKIISLSLGTTTLDVRDLYSRWKDWLENDVGTKYIQAFTVVGGDPIDIVKGIYVTSYFFLINGWRVRPQEASHTLTVENGIILTDTGVDPFILTLGTYEIQIKYSQPIKSETVSTGGGSGGLTTAEHDELMAIQPGIRGVDNDTLKTLSDQIDTISMSSSGLSVEEHNQLMKTLTTAKFLALK